jgi:plastocyanin
MRQALYDRTTFLSTVILLAAVSQAFHVLSSESLLDRPALAAGSMELQPAPASKNDEKVATKQVAIENFTFRPPVLTVPAGTKVTWVNSDDVPHTVTSTKKVFASPTLDTDDRFEFVFDQPGTFEYFCAVHRHMVGKVIVTKPKSEE